MATEITVPTLGESLSEATVATWLKSVGDAVQADEPILELETDKVTIEVNAPAGGTLTQIAAEEGAEVVVGALLGVIGEGATATNDDNIITVSCRLSITPSWLPAFMTSQRFFEYLKARVACFAHFFSSKDTDY